MGYFRNWAKGETGTSEFMPTVWHQTANDFPVVNHQNPVCAIYRHATGAVKRKRIYLSLSGHIKQIPSFL